MTDLDRLRAQQPPRSTGLCLRYCLRYEGTGGFIAYGVLWAFPALGAATAAAVFVTPTAPALGFLAATFVMWGLYFAWVAQRTARARRFFRRGVVVDGRIESVTPGEGRSAGMAWFTVKFEVDGREGKAATDMFTGRGNAGILVVGSEAPVIYVPGESRCGVFAYDGKLRMADCGVASASDSEYRRSA